MAIGGKGATDAMATKLEITIEALVKDQGFKKVKKALDDIDKSAKKGGSTLKRLEGGLDVLGKSFGALAGAAATFKQAFELAEQGAMLQRSAAQFENLTESIDSTADVMLTRLRDATGGLVSDADLIASATQIINLGMGKTEDQVVRLAKVVGTLGINMDVLTLTLANDSKMRLDSLGLSIEGVTKKQKELEAQGVSTLESFDEAVIASLEDKMILLGDATNDNAAAWQTARVTLQEYTNSAKDLLATGLTPWIRLLNGELQQSLKKNKRALVESGVTLEEYIKIVKETDTVWQGSKFRVQELTDEFEELSTVIATEVATSFDRKLVNAVNSAADATDDYAIRQLFITRALEMSTEKQAAWNDDVFEAQILAEKMAGATDSAGGSMASAVVATTDYARAIETLTEKTNSYFDSASRNAPTQFDFNELLFDAAKAAGAPLDVLADLGVELGLMTPAQAKLATEFQLAAENADKLGEALASGMGVEEAITAQQTFRDDLKETENSYRAVGEAARKVSDDTLAEFDKVAGAIMGISTAAAEFVNGSPYNAQFNANVTVSGSGADLLDRFGREFFQPEDDLGKGVQTTNNTTVNVNIPVPISPGMGSQVGSTVANELGQGAR